jgi:hypothetical protein
MTKVTPKRTITALYLSRVAVLTVIVIVMFTVASQLSTMVIINRYDDQQILRMNGSFQSLDFSSKESISNITGQKYLILKVNSEKSNITAYSPLASENCVYVGMLTQDGTKSFMVVSANSLKNDKTYIVTGNVGYFKAFEKDDVLPIYYVTEFHEPKLLEEFVAQNMFIFCSIAILAWAGFIAFLVGLLGYALLTL